VKPIVRLENVAVRFTANLQADETYVTRVHKSAVDALRNVSLDVMPNEILSIVGESGCGKTTLCRTVIGLTRPTSGNVYVNERRVNFGKSGELRKLWRTCQMIFQDPYSTFNPLSSVFDVMAIPLRKFGIARTDAEIQERMEKVFAQVGLSYTDLEGKYPSQLSGGQRQRLAVARALSIEPSVIIADEPVSMLDMSLRAGILDLIIELNKKQGVTVIFITHDIAVARYISDRIAVMYKGSVVELASAGDLLDSPQHPYTQLLLSAAPHLKEKSSWSKELGVVLRNLDPDTVGCKFYPRCPLGFNTCVAEVPSLDELASNHLVACFARTKKPP
jgi:oligopeptide/dipeptide ABC transporter ATP-binding protein